MPGAPVVKIQSKQPLKKSDPFNPPSYFTVESARKSGFRGALAKLSDCQCTLDSSF